MKKFMLLGAAGLFGLAISVVSGAGCSSTSSSTDGGTETDTGTETDSGVDSCTPSITCASANAACGAIDDGCGTSLDCGNCDGGGTCTANQCTATACALTAPYPNLVSASSMGCVLMNCCDEENAWSIAQPKGGCGSNGCDGDCKAYCTCLGSKCNNMP